MWIADLRFEDLEYRGEPRRSEAEGDGGYRVEVAIPWSTFGVTPARGLVLGFALSVSDNDDSDKNVQQTMISTSPSRALDNPATWGLLTLR